MKILYIPSCLSVLFKKEKTIKTISVFFVLFCCFQTSVFAQVTISTSTSDLQKSCNGCSDGFLGSGADPNSDVNFSVTGTIHCPTSGTFRLRACDDDDYGGCGGALDDCVASNSTTYTITYSGCSPCSGNDFAVRYPPASGQCGARIDWSVTRSGSFAANLATPNNTCANAFSMGTNGSGTRIDHHTAECHSPLWYVYTLTDANLSYIEFDITHEAWDGGMSEDEVRFGSCTGCTMSDDGGVGVWRIDNPKPGTYYIRGSIGFAAPTNPEYFDVVVTKGATVTRPANDNICGATVAHAGFNYNSSDFTITGVSTQYASSEDVCNTNEPNNDNELSVWWKFTTGANPPAKITFNPNGTGADCAGQMWLYSGAPTGACTGSAFSNYATSTNFNGLSLIDYTETGGNVVLSCPSPNTTYYIQGQVGCAVSADWGTISIAVDGNGAPKMPNDLCAGAINLGILTAGGTIGDATGANKWNNFCATTTGDPNPNWTVAGIGTSPYQTVWFKFNSGAVGRNVTIEAYNDPGNHGDWIDLKLALYGGTCGALTLIDKDYDPGIPATGALYGEVMEDDYCLTPNTDYYVLVSGSNVESITGSTKEGFFGLTVKDNGPYPSNDLICGAKSLPVQTQYTYNSTQLTNENNTRGTYCFEPDPDWTGELGRDNDHGVWYYFGQVPGRTIVVDANDIGSDDINIQMTLYSSTTAKGACTTPASSPSLTEVQKEFNIASGNEDAYFNCLNPNLYYWLLVDGADVSGTGALSALEEGDFSIRAWFPEEGETNACNAEDLGAIPLGGSRTILNLSNICGASSIANFTPPSTWGFDKAVVYKFTTPPASAGVTDASVKIEAFTNPYYPSQMNDFLENVNLAGDDIDLQLAVYSAGACGATHNAIASNYDPTNVNVSAGSDESVIANCLTPNTVYYLVVDGGVNTNGYYDIKMSDYGKHTTNDFLYQATDISGTYSAPWTNCNSNTIVTLTGQNNYCATNNNDFPAYLTPPGRPSSWDELNSVVWYKFKAPKSGKLQIRAKNTVSDVLPPYDEPEIDIQLAVFQLPGGYQGALNASTLVANKERLILLADDFDGVLHDEDLDVDCLQPDSIYYLAVDGSSYTGCPTCQRGEFYLELEADPRDSPASNELPCEAIPLGQPIQGSKIVGTKTGVGGTNSIPTTGYGALHNVPRSAVCMRAENNFCKGTAGEPAVAGGTFLTDFSPDQTVWYQFQAPATGEILIKAHNDPSSVGDQIDLQLAVYESSDNTCSGILVPIKAEYNIGPFSEDLTVKCLEPNKNYWLMVDGSAINVQGYFEVSIEAVTATESGPANDDICNATPVAYPGSIGATTTVNSQTNRCATIQSGVYPDPTTFSTDADVWYSFTTPNTAAPHAVEVEVTSGLPWPFGDAMDPQIALYKRVGTCPSATFELVDDGYSALGLPFYESFEFHCLEQNTTYYLMVDGSGLNEQGNFKVDITRINPHPLPTNDDICQVGTTPANGYLGVLGGSTGNKIGNTSTNWHNFCADVETNEDNLMTDGNYALDQTVWFHFKTPNIANNIDVEIRALNDPNNVGDQIDLQMLLVQGNPSCPFSTSTFDGLSAIESDDPLLTFNSTINTCLPPNTDFYIQVDGSGLNTQGYFTLEIENMGTASAPANDNICNAKLLPASGTITGSYTGYPNDNNICATLENFEVQQDPGGIQRSVWYKFVAPASADVSVEVAGNSWVPFTTNYFLPDVTIWELSDDTYASIDNTIAGCPNPSAANWSKLQYNDYQVIPNSLANGLYPTVVLTPLCLKPGYTYYVQVDGVAGIGLDGYFEINIKDNQTPYTAPTNNEAATAATVPISTTTCQYGNGTWQGAYSFGNNPTWSNPNLIGIANASGIPACTQNCGDVWYKFQVPPACGNNTKTFIKIEGDDEFNLDLNGYPELAIAAYSGPSSGSTANLTYLKCSVGGGTDPDFSISANPGDYIYLQIWDLAGNEQDKTFKLCVSEQKSADDCVDATDMTLDVPYCWSVESNGGETPNSAVPGSGLNTCFGDGMPEHSSYFKFTTAAAADFCDDYYIYINTDALARDLSNPAVNDACLSAIPSISFNLSLYKLVGTPCTPGTSNAVLENCQTFTDCGGGSVGSNVVGPHGNGGILNDTIWYNLGGGTALLPNTTYYIVLDYQIENFLYEGRVVLDGIIEVGRRCKGRTWEYATSTVSTDKYCTTRDGWRHYYDDKGTVSTDDDKYILSLYPNGNNFEGTATITVLPTYSSAEEGLFAEYTMKRYWDFDITSGSISNNILVRFYYTDAEKQAIITAANNFVATHPGTVYEPFEWFKSQNGIAFDPAIHVTPTVVIAGYSETGCESLWDASGTYVGVPVQRCGVITAEDHDDDPTNEWCNGVQYVEYGNIPGLSGGTGATGASPYSVSPLPVELLSFTGYNDGQINVLNWITASEINTDKFIIERSPNGVGFNQIGEVDAAGNSSAELSYNFNDESPLLGNNYYRLKIVDNDGTYEYSNIILLNVNHIVKDAIANIYPNPTNAFVNIDYQSTTNNNLNINIYDATGKLMLNKQEAVNEGLNKLILDLSVLAKGTYILQMNNQDGTLNNQVKLIKN
ncbi:MAG: T9SS type A sorting domain-containing protein [Chitinophagales bacterium]|nr:T9SS type A sorting domain-containing protein [Chitinophagales bacterium]